MLSIKKFEDWILKSRPGDKISYYRGYIMAPYLQKYSPTMDERRVRSLKNRVYHAYDNNVVTLVQRRHGDLDYEYIMDYYEEMWEQQELELEDIL